MEFVLGLLVVARVEGFLCERVGEYEHAKCDVPHELEYCTSSSYAACRMYPEWQEQEQVALNKTREIQRRYGNFSSVSSKSTEESWLEECLEVIKRFQCANAFPACESINGRAELVCDSECDLIAQTCGITDQVALGFLCATRHDLEAEDSCFSIYYTGPTYYLWIIGLGITVIFSFLSSLAINLQKLSLNRHKASVPVLKQPLWVLGFALIVLGSLMDFVALGLAPASLLAPLAALTLVWNMAVAPFFLKEKLTHYQVLATLIIFAGAVITVIFSNHTSPLYTLSDLKSLYRRNSMKVYTVVVPLFIIAHILLVERIGSFPSSKRSKTIYRRAHMMGYAGAAGTIGGQSVLFGKSTVELLKAGIGGDPGVGLHLETYVIVSGLVCCLLMQIHYLNGGLRYYDALFVVPIYQSYWIISGVLGGLVYFDEIRTFTPLQAGMFSLGILISIAGIVMLAHRAPTRRRRRHRQLSDASEFSQDGGVPDFDEASVEDEEEEDDKSERTRFVSQQVFEAWLDMTPRHSAADVMLDMGIDANRVRRMLGETPADINRKRREMILEDMGVTPDIANRMLNSEPSSETATPPETETETKPREAQVESKPTREISLT